MSGASPITGSAAIDGSTDGSGDSEVIAAAAAQPPPSIDGKGTLINTYA